ncbi:MAG: leucine-rich repeat domain-containing protein, partial [Clostridia bacterium]|nr:leucine-rich repeat domain-containing protein [Clostridia bacterium]
MKKGSILLVVLLLMLGLCIPAAAEEGEPTVYTSGDYQYILLADGTAEITRCYSKEVELTVPDTLDGHSVTSIGDRAFHGCYSLTSITLPEGLTSIGDRAFSGCFSLTGITLPDSVTEMGINPFIGCEKLTDIRVSADQPVFATIDGVLFNKAEKKLICYPRAFTATEYQVPRGICSIGDYAFSGCYSLTGIILPEGLTSIGDYAFFRCTSLMNITLPEGLIHIGDDTFFGCDSLTSITLPDSVTEMGINPFIGCEKLTDIRVSPAQPVFATIDGVLFNKTE